MNGSSSNSTTIGVSTSFPRPSQDINLMNRVSYFSATPRSPIFDFDHHELAQVVQETVSPTSSSIAAQFIKYTRMSGKQFLELDEKGLKTLSNDDPAVFEEFKHLQTSPPQFLRLLFSPNQRSPAITQQFRELEPVIQRTRIENPLSTAITNTSKNVVADVSIPSERVEVGEEFEPFDFESENDDEEDVISDDDDASSADDDAASEEDSPSHSENSSSGEEPSIEDSRSPWADSQPQNGHSPSAVGGSFIEDPDRSNISQSPASDKHKSTYEQDVINRHLDFAGTGTSSHIQTPYSQQFSLDHDNATGAIHQNHNAANKDNTNIPTRPAVSDEQVNIGPFLSPSADDYRLTVDAIPGRQESIELNGSSLHDERHDESQNQNIHDPNAVELKTGVCTSSEVVHGHPTPSIPLVDREQSPSGCIESDLSRPKDIGSEYPNPSSMPHEDSLGSESPSIHFQTANSATTSSYASSSPRPRLQSILPISIPTPISETNESPRPRVPSKFEDEIIAERQARFSAAEITPSFNSEIAGAPLPLPASSEERTNSEQAINNTSGALSPLLVGFSSASQQVEEMAAETLTSMSPYLQTSYPNSQDDIHKGQGLYILDPASASTNVCCQQPVNQDRELGQFTNPNIDSPQEPLILSLSINDHEAILEPYLPVLEHESSFPHSLPFINPDHRVHEEMSTLNVTYGESASNKENDSLCHAVSGQFNSDAVSITPNSNFVSGLGAYTPISTSLEEELEGDLRQPEIHREMDASANLRHEVIELPSPTSLSQRAQNPDRFATIMGPPSSAAPGPGLQTDTNHDTIIGEAEIKLASQQSDVLFSLAPASNLDGQANSSLSYSLELRYIPEIRPWSSAWTNTSDQILLAFVDRPDYDYSRSRHSVHGDDPQASLSLTPFNLHGHRTRTTDDNPIASPSRSVIIHPENQFMITPEHWPETLSPDGSVSSELSNLAPCGSPSHNDSVENSLLILPPFNSEPLLTNVESHLFNAIGENSSALTTPQHPPDLSLGPGANSDPLSQQPHSAKPSMMLGLSHDLAIGTLPESRLVDDDVIGAELEDSEQLLNIDEASDWIRQGEREQDDDDDRISSGRSLLSVSVTPPTQSFLDEFSLYLSSDGPVHPCHDVADASPMAAKPTSSSNKSVHIPPRSLWPVSESYFDGPQASTISRNNVEAPGRQQARGTSKLASTSRSKDTTATSQGLPVYTDASVQTDLDCQRELSQIQRRDLRRNESTSSSPLSAILHESRFLSEFVPGFLNLFRGKEIDDNTSVPPVARPRPRVEVSEGAIFPSFQGPMSALCKDDDV